MRKTGFEKDTRYSIDQVVDSRAREIVNYITSRAADMFKPSSMYLLGSFGTGEVAAQVNGSEINFLSDCDLIIISCRYCPPARIYTLIREVAAKYHIELQVAGMITRFYLLIPGLSRFMRPSIWHYSHKYGSRVIYGRDYLYRIPAFTPGDILRSEGYRLMLSRVATYIESTLKRKIPGRSVTYNKYKIVLSCRDALLIAADKYDPSYRVRSRNFQEIFACQYPGLASELPGFLDLTVELTELYISGGNKQVDVDELNESVSVILDKVLRYLAKNVMGFEYGDYLEFQQRFIDRLRESDGYAFFPRMLLENLRGLINQRLSGIHVPLKPGAVFRYPHANSAFSLMPLLYFAMQKGRINTAYLKRIRQVLASLLNLEEERKDAWDEYRYLSAQTIALFKPYLGRAPEFRKRLNT